jgi:menaquinone-specific isochorismate synthase
VPVLVSGIGDSAYPVGRMCSVPLRIPGYMDFVFLDIAPDMAVLGTGPFQFAPELPDNARVAFYVNDFGLNQENCWAIPANARQVASPLAAAEVSFPELSDAASWEPPCRGDFSRVFGDISTRLADGRLNKAVPAVVERVRLNVSRARNGSTAASLHYDAARPGEAFRYGYRLGGHGAFGVTPESLVTMADGVLRSMALAGTAPAAGRAVFVEDSKQIREHQFVVDALAESLSQFGHVETGARKVVEFARLLHFQSLLSVKLPNGAPDPAEVVRAIHPTPAVGVLPRTEQNLRVLDDYRAQLGVPAAFGAPLGVWRDSAFHAVAAIRGLFWNEGDGCLPAGCGVISESIEDREWEELNLKRAWVKERIGLV